MILKFSGIRYDTASYDINNPKRLVEIEVDTEKHNYSVVTYYGTTTVERVEHNAIPKIRMGKSIQVFSNTFKTELIN